MASAAGSICITHVAGITAAEHTIDDAPCFDQAASGLSCMATGEMISIVDDDPSMREMLGSLLRSLGYNARAFASGEEFLASDDFERFACVVSDIHMPGMDGFELKRRLDEKSVDSLPVILITARTECDIERRALSCGAVGFLRKPFDGDALAGLIKQALAD